MIELRWTTPEGTTTKQPKLQYRALFYPVLIASGDIVLMPYETAEWMDVPLAILPSNV